MAKLKAMSTGQLLEQLERSTISFITTGQLKAFEMVESIKTEINSRQELSVLKRKKGIATVVQVGVHQYILQHPNQMKRGGTDV
jgi:hypothetical protein